MHFRQGFAYIIGFDNPVLVSNARIREGAEELGFEMVGLHECDIFTGLPFATPTPCGDDWDYIAIVRRLGADRWIDLPDRVAWVVSLPPPQLLPPTPAKPGEPPPPAITQPTLVARKQAGKVDRRRTVHMVAEAAGLAVALPVGWWASSKIKQKRPRYALRAVLVTMATVDALLLWAYLRE